MNPEQRIKRAQRGVCSFNRVIRNPRPQKVTSEERHEGMRERSCSYLGRSLPDRGLEMGAHETSVAPMR